MRKEAALRFAAIWMSVLIITIPFYISEAYGAADQTINILKINGKDGINGIRRAKGDMAHIDVEVFSPTPLTGQNIQLKSTIPGSAGVTFQTCTDLSPYICKYETSIGDVPAGAYSYYACIGSCDQCFQASCKKSATIAADGLAPVVESVSFAPAMANGGTVKLHYRISDRACLATKCSGLCSGLSKAEIYDINENGTKKLVSTITLNLDSCSVENDYDFSTSSLKNGERRICLVAYDKFMQNSSSDFASGSSCAELIKDNTPPALTGIRLLDATGTYDAKYVAAEGTTAKLVVNLTTSALFSLVGNKIAADLTSLGGGSVYMSCMSIGNGNWKCSYPFTVKISSSGSKSIRINATDEGGNTYSADSAFSMIASSGKPIVDKITSEHELRGVGYLKPGYNVVIAVIKGDSLAFSNVFFNIGAETGKKAECTGSSGAWTCMTNATVGSGQTSTVTVYGNDDAGYSFSETKGLPVDTSAPKLEKVVIRNMNSLPYLVTEDDLLVKALITDNYGVVDDAGRYNVIMTPDGFYDPSPLNAESCAFDDATELWTCQWTLMNLVPGKVKMRLNISDFVGNAITKDASRFDLEYLESVTGAYTSLKDTAVEVYEVENRTVDYWKAKAGNPIPRFVDSSTTVAIEHDVFVPVSLQRKNGGATLYQSTLTSCSGNDFDSYVKEAMLMSPVPGSEKPFLRITLKQGEIKQNQLLFNCTMNLISLYNNKISRVEVESFKVTLPVVAAGELTGSVLMELARVSNSWLVKASWMDMITKIIGIMQKLCGILMSISKIARSLALFQGTMAFCEKSTFCYPAAKVADVTARKGHLTKVLGFNKLYTFCAYVSCGKTIWGGPMEDLNKGWSESINSWLYSSTGGGVDTAGKTTGGPGKGSTSDVSNKADTSNKVKFAFFGSPEAQKDYKGNKMSQDEMKRLGLDTKSLFGDVAVWGNPSNSLILSLATGCIPGIFMNLQKARQIECQYLSCLVNDVPAGMPIRACSKVRAFQWCMFVYGEIFQIIPFASSIKSMLGSITSLLKNPLSLIFGLTGMACQYIPSMEANAACNFLDAVNSIMRLVNTIQQILGAKDMFNLKGSDSCKTTLQTVQQLLTQSASGATVGAEVKPASAGTTPG